ncbi:hypothetical protein BV372_15630 [Nostoc sp. T09]|nr:hypothetical protein BV372_15630 [Nostoc sp. T09]
MASINSHKNFAANQLNILINFIFFDSGCKKLRNGEWGIGHWALGIVSFSQSPLVLLIPQFLINQNVE